MNDLWHGNNIMVAFGLGLFKSVSRSYWKDKTLNCCQESSIKGYQIQYFLLHSFPHGLRKLISQKEKEDKLKPSGRIAKQLNRSRSVIKCFLHYPDSYGKKNVGRSLKKLPNQSQTFHQGGFMRRIFV